MFPFWFGFLWGAVLVGWFGDFWFFVCFDWGFGWVCLCCDWFFVCSCLILLTYAGVWEYSLKKQGKTRVISCLPPSERYWIRRVCPWQPVGSVSILILSCIRTQDFEEDSAEITNLDLSLRYSQMITSGGSSLKLSIWAEKANKCRGDRWCFFLSARSIDFQ